MKLIAFTGMPGSGKSEAVQTVSEIGIPVIRMGDMVWEEVKKRGLKLTDKNVGEIASKMREEQGMDIWARKTLDKIKSLVQAEALVIDGIRNLEEVNRFRKELRGDFFLVAVVADKETRYKRLLHRQRQDDSTIIKDLEMRDKRELEWGLGSVIASADIVILNEGSIDELHEKVRESIRNI
jgi:dephospho-CoA kinase